MARHPHYWDPGIPKADGVIWNFNVDPQLSVLRILKGEQDLMYEPVTGGLIDQIRNDPSKKHLLEMTPGERALVGLDERESAGAEESRCPEGDRYGHRQAKTPSRPQGRRFARNGRDLLTPKPVLSGEPGAAVRPESCEAVARQGGLRLRSHPQSLVGELLPLGGDGAVGPAGSDSDRDHARLPGDDVQPVHEYTNTAPAGLVFFNWGLSYPHGSYIFDAGFTKAAVTAGCCNYAHWVDPRVERLAVAARRTPSQQKSISIYKQIDRIITQEQAVWVPLIYAARPDLHSARLKGWASLHGGTDEPKISTRSRFDGSLIPQRFRGA